MMDAFEKKIAEALERDAAEQFEKMGADQSLIGMMIGGFQGQLMWLKVIMSFIMLIGLVGAVFCTIRFFQADELRGMMSWGFGSFMLMFIVSFLKLFLWLEMERNAVVREVKRVEIQIASMSNRMSA